VLPLKQATALDDLQRYVAEMEEERGFSHVDVVQQCLQLGEEVGELFKAVRKHEKMRMGTTSVTGTVDEELADVLIFLCAIANRLGISIDEALRKKEALNETRTWK
jgi:NTP pyrophosphatase (non-canonical NTP hydrolase)